MKTLSGCRVQSFILKMWLGEKKKKDFFWMQPRLGANIFKPKVVENGKGGRKKKKRGYQSEMVTHSHTGNFVIDSRILSRWEHYPGLLISKGVYFGVTLIVTLKCKWLNLIQWRLTAEISPCVCHRPTHLFWIQENYLPVTLSMRVCGGSEMTDDWFIWCQLCPQSR